MRVLQQARPVSFLATFFVALLLTLHSVSQAAESRTNVLFLMADDLNNLVGCYDEPDIKTPNMDRLAARGVRFNHTYCQYPLCGPSRNSMLTGLYPNSSGILGNSQIFRQTIPDHVSLPQAFRLSGYFAARLGKLYHYAVPNSVGTVGHDDPASWELEINPAGVDRLDDQDKIFSLIPGQFGGVLSWYASPRADAYHTDGMLASDAEWVLERCAKKNDRPFFVAVGFFRPHTPFVAPEDPYYGYYPVDDMPVVTGVKEDQKDIPPAALASRKPEESMLTDARRKECRQAYCASISFMDAQVGRVLDALDRLGLADNTVIVMTSDHGYHMGEHGLWKKMSLFEESARVPLIIAAPNVGKKGTVVEAPVGLIDLYPTLTELCDVDTPENLQGQSLVPMLKDPSEQGRGWTLSQVSRGRRNGNFFGYSIRTPRWRYTEWDGGKQGRELYDHDSDPKERNNLADDPKHQDVVKELSAKLAKAVEGTFPPDGKTPPIQEGLWKPMLTD